MLLRAQIVQPLSADNNVLFRYMDMFATANRTTRQPTSLLLAGYGYEVPPTEMPFYVSAKQTFPILACKEVFRKRQEVTVKSKTRKCRASSELQLVQLGKRSTFQAKDCLGPRGGLIETRHRLNCTLHRTAQIS